MRRTKNIRNLEPDGSTAKADGKYMAVTHDLFGLPKLRSNVRTPLCACGNADTSAQAFLSVPPEINECQQLLKRFCKPDKDSGVCDTTNTDFAGKLLAKQLETRTNKKPFGNTAARFTTF